VTNFVHEGQFISRDNVEGMSVEKKTEKKGAVVDKEPVDFFGRPIKKKEPETQQIPGEKAPAPLQPKKKFKVAYRFNEGASAAVRKPVKMNSFL